MAEQRSSAAKWAVHEIPLTSTRTFGNAYTEVTVSAAFTGPDGVARTVKGFWDGGNSFKVRFAPTVEGPWTYSISSSPPDRGLTKTGTLTVGPPSAANHGFLRRDPAHPYSFVWDDGTRFFMWGQTYYQIILNAMADGPWRVAVDKIASYGMTKVRMLLTTWCGPGSNPYPCVFPFVSRNHDTLNLAYWQKLAEIVQYLGSKGLVADLEIFTNATSAFGTRIQDERYVRYAIARFSAYHNVIWCLTNEWNYTNKSQAYWNTIGSLVRNEDPWLTNGTALRPLSIHQRTGIDFEFVGSGWPVHAIIQYGVRNRQYANGDEWGNTGIVHNRSKNMPVVNDEYGYIGEAPRTPVTVFDRTQHRRVIWGIAVGGGFGSAGDHANRDRTSPIFSTNWIERAEYNDIQRLVTFWSTKGIQYWTMSPRNDLGTAGTRVYVLANPGVEYVAYAAIGGNFSLNLAPATYRYEWFNPLTGAVAGTGTFTASAGNRLFTPPFSGDAVLYLKKQ